MKRLRVLGRLTAGFLLITLTLLAPTAAFAADGEIGDLSDTDSITDLTVSGGRITARIDYLKDCPGGLSGCEIQVNFRYKCPEWWCSSWTSQGWRTIPLPTNGISTVQGNCNGGEDIDNYWEMDYRVRWFATTTKTVTWKGELEYMLGANGSVGNKLIAEGAFNHTNSAGITGYTSIETVTATADWSPAVIAATSGGRVFRTC